MPKLPFSIIQQLSFLLLFVLLSSFTVEQVVQEQLFAINCEDPREEERSLEWEEESAEWEKEKNAEPQEYPPLLFCQSSCSCSNTEQKLWSFACQPLAYSSAIPRQHNSSSCPRYIQFCCLKIHLF